MKMTRFPFMIIPTLFLISYSAEAMASRQWYILDSSRVCSISKTWPSPAAMIKRDGYANRLGITVLEGTKQEPKAVMIQFLSMADGSSLLQYAQEMSMSVAYAFFLNKADCETYYKEVKQAVATANNKYNSQMRSLN